MKPKKRVKQGQSARLYLRGNDHRDIVLNDAYVNHLLFSKSSRAGSEAAYYTLKTLKRYWTKYPRRSLLVALFSSTNDYGVGYYDIDRDVFHNNSFGNNVTNMNFWRLKDFCVMASTYDTSNTYATDDGCFWERVTGPSSMRLYLYGVYSPNQNMIVYVNNGTSYSVSDKLYIYVYEFYRSASDDRIHARYFSNNYTLDTTYSFEMGNIISRYGKIVLLRPNSTTINYLVAYRVTLTSVEKLGIVSPPSDAFHNYNIVNSYSQMSTRYNSDGSDTIVITTSDRASNEAWLLSYTSHDSGKTWVSTRIKSVSNTSSVENILCLRDGVFYVYMSQYNYRNFYAFKSTDGIEWTEISLPDYIELDIKSSGCRVDPSPAYKKVRVKLKTTSPDSTDPNTVNYDVYNSFMYRTSQERAYFYGPNEAFGGVMANNGKFANSDSWLSFRGVNGNYFFFDNPELTPTKNSFMIYTVPPDDFSGIDYVLEDDYCVKGE